MSDESVFPEEMQPFTRVGRDGTFYRPVGGLTLRDYFAVKAMQELIPLLSNTDDADDEMRKLGLDEGEFDKLVAKCAYDYADAMLKARERGP